MNQTLITNQLRHQRILTIRQRTARRIRQRIRQRIHQKTVQRIHQKILIISHQIAQIATRWQAAYAAYIFFWQYFWQNVL